VTPLKPTIDVFVLGESAERSLLAEPDWPAALRLIPTSTGSLTEFARSAWASELAEGESDLAAIVVGCDREAFRDVAISAILFGPDPSEAGYLAVGPIDSASEPIVGRRMGGTTGSTSTTGSTTGIGLLLNARAEHGPLLLRRCKLREIGPVRAVAEPVWDWAIRATRAGMKINPSAVNKPSRSDQCRLPLLVPPARGPEADWLREHLTKTAVAELISGKSRRSAVDEIAFRAGLYQWHDFFDEGHELAQSIEGQGENRLGDYWHAIMHRREPDYSNAKYWFRQIGNQPTYRELRRQADAILADCKAPDAGRWRERLQAGSKWDPFAFVDLCEECADDESSALALAARRIQYAEMSLLM
jgi:hypothetical protein